MDAERVLAELRVLGQADGLAAWRRLSQGGHADVWLISYADGRRIVAKALADAPADLLAVEADGLAALRGTGQLDAPWSWAAPGS